MKKFYAGKVAQSKYYFDICSALHFNQATESPTTLADGYFNGRGRRHSISSVPCGALMRPLPGSRCRATGSGTFSVLNGNIIY